jgi:chaperone BCS1
MDFSMITWVSTTLETVLNYINVISGGNEFMAGLISASVLGGFTFLVKDIPSTIFAFIKRQTITKITINNGGYDGNSTLFSSFLAWYSESYWINYSRSLSLEKSYTAEGRTYSRSAGFGWHMLVKYGRFFWFYKTALDSSGAEREKHEITIYTFGRDSQSFDKIINDFKPRDITEDELTISSWTGDNWSEPEIIPSRDQNTVIINSEVRGYLYKNMDNFINNRDWYLSNGLPHKLSIVLHGPSGTGKTSIIKMMASKYNRDIYTINLNNVTDETIVRAIREADRGSIIAIEDFEQLASVRDRDNNSSQDDMSKALSPLSMSGFLNAMDGLVPVDDMVIIFTTNHIELVDEAVYRKGRVDLLLEILPLESQDVVQYMDLKFPAESEHKTLTFDGIKGCDLQAKYIDHHQDYTAMLNSLDLMSMDGKG